jgi:hypothetical protein
MRFRNVFFFACVALGFALFVPQLATAQAPAAAAFGHNLLQNGNAEADTGAADPEHVVKPTGWTTAGEFTTVQYGASGGFPTKTTAGPTDRGKNFFGGGNAKVSTATQTVSLADAAQQIDAGTVTYTLSGWLGGYESQGDTAEVAVTFLDAAGAKLTNGQIGPVTAADRKSKLELLQRTASGAVPAHARSAQVVITATRTDGAYNDGYSDDISLVLANKK